VTAVTLFRIEPERSKLWIDATSSLHPIHTETDGLEGSFEADLLDSGQLDPSSPPKADLQLAVRLLTSGNPFYDREIQRRTESRKFPTISGRLTSMQPTEEAGRYLVGGELTFRGTTRSVDGEMTLTAPDARSVQLDGQQTFDMRDFGMNPPRILTLRVHPEVTVRVAIVASRED
jgi:polyisoprenoid-binding protein YceI